MPPTAQRALYFLSPRLRHAVVALAVPTSLLIGFACIWLYAPRAFQPLLTLDLAVILSLIALPAAAMWALIVERKSASEAGPAVHHEPGPTPQRAHASPRTVRHPASDRVTAEPAHRTVAS